MITEFRRARTSKYFVASLAILFLLSLLPAPLHSTTAAARQSDAPAAGSDEQERGLGLSTPNSTGVSYALVIGNNAYRQLPKLQTAENDAREVEKLLRDSYGFRTRLLLNGTRQQIVGAFSAYRRDLSSEDNLLVYYAGHGINDTEAGRAYWLPVDSSREDSSNWISADDITAGTKAIPAKHVLVISDSCYSGTLTRGIGEMLPRPSDREQFLRKMMSGRSRTLMASGGNEPVADGGGGGRHSVFASALLRGLRQMDKDQFTAAELFRSYVEESVAGRANQTPEYNPLRNSGHESGDFVFVRMKPGDKTAAMTTTATATPAINAANSSQARSTQGGGETAASEPRQSVEAPAVVETNPNDLAGTTWTGNSPNAGYTGEFAVEFLKGGQLRYVITVRENGELKQRAVKGTWRQSGDVVQIVIGNSYSVLQGRLDGTTLRAEGENTEGTKLNWLLLKK
ncbi:MAG TPA: caspase family protein [Pyrinomonadaceae bacterium]|nr:caspase family protein [Pyrinomonadaceae bacterium]